MMNRRIGPFLSLIAAALPLACSSATEPSPGQPAPQSETKDPIAVAPLETSVSGCDLVATYEAVATDRVIDQIVIDSAELENTRVEVSLFELDEMGEMILIDRRSEESSIVDSAFESAKATESSAAAAEVAENARESSTAEEVRRSELETSSEGGPPNTLDEVATESSEIQEATTIAESHDVLDHDFAYRGDAVAEEALAQRFETASERSESTSECSESVRSLDEVSIAQASEAEQSAVRSSAAEVLAATEALQEREYAEQSRAAQEVERKEALSSRTHTFSGLEDLALSRVIIQLQVHGAAPASAVEVTAATSEQESSTTAFALPVLACP